MLYYIVILAFPKTLKFKISVSRALSTYEEYVNEQRQKINQVLVTSEQLEEQKQVELRKLVYDELLKKYQTLMEEKKVLENEKRMLEEMVMEYMDKENKDTVYEVSFEKMRRIMIENQFRTIALIFDKEKKLKWGGDPSTCASRIS